MSLLEGHGDITMDRAGADRIPSAERFSRVLRQRRQQRGLAKLFSTLIGLDAKLRQYEAGRAVHRGGRGRRAVRAAGQGVAGPAVAAAMAEIREPSRWIARVDAGAADLPGPASVSRRLA